MGHRWSYVLSKLLTISENKTNDIVGWDTQLIAREASAETLPLESDMNVNQAQKEYILLWRNSEKPKAPFNLTPFAITLVGLLKNMEYELILMLV